MPPGDPNDCPECKVVIDGGLAEKVFAETCYAIKDFRDKGGKLDDVGKIIKKLIKAENASFEFMRASIEGMGYHGEHGWPLCLMTIEEIKALPD